MSKNEWEHGEIKLPSAEFSKVRKKIQDADTKHKNEVFAHTQAFWKSLTPKQKKDYRAYEDAINAYCYGSGEQRIRFGRMTRENPPKVADVQVADSVREAVSSAMERKAPEVPGSNYTYTARRVQKTDMDFPTNRTTVFRCGYEGAVSFDRERSTVTWSVSENNHAVESARDHHVAEAFFRSMGDVRWTPNTGGVISGNDEYNRDSEYVGGGANYCTGAFGPIGAASDPVMCQEYTDSKGRRITHKMMWEAAEKERRRQERAMKKLRSSQGGTGQGRVQRGTPRGGQYANRQYGSGGSLT